MEKLQPTLRFPEFEEDWVRIELKELSEKVNSGKTPLGGEAVYSSDGILFIRSQNVNNDRLELVNKTYISSEINEGMKNSIVKSNDILLNITGASLGRSCVVPANFTIGNVNQHVCIIRLKNVANPRFIQPQFSSKKGQDLFQSLQVGGGREGLNFESIKKIKITLPSIDEQSKIATFLSSVDEKLNLLKEKKACLEEYKKGMMQQIFSQQLRFKDEDGKDFGDWVEKSLGEICDVNKGNQLNKDSLNKIDPYPCISGGIEPSGFTNEYNRNENTIIISEGGNSCGFVNFITTKFWCGGHCYSIDLKNDSISNSFLFQLLKFNQLEIMKLRVGSGLPNIQKKDLLKFEIKISKNLKEQTKIANFLSAIDEKITTVAEVLEATREYKRGLLQGMFC